MQTILKYPLQATADQTLLIPCGAAGIEVLTAEYQPDGSRVCLWVRTDSESAVGRKVRVHVRTTGAPMGEAELGAQYVNTVLMGHGAKVLHVFVQADANVRVRGY